MALDFGAEFVGLGDLARKVADLPARLGEAEKNTVRRASLEALRIFRLNVSGPILHVRTGAYRASTNAGEPQRDGEGWFAPVGVKRGAAEKYAPVHEFGTNRAGRDHNITIPARRPLGISGETEAPRLPVIGNEEIARAVRGLGL